MLISVVQEKSIYITLVVVFSLIILALIFLPLIRNLYIKNHFQKCVYRKVYNCALYNDFYLINSLPISNGDRFSPLDHVLFSDKYIYVIKDRYYKDAISASINDKVWLSYSSNGATTELPNPIMLNELRCNKFAISKNIDRSFFISIVVVNDDAYIEQKDELNSFNSFICRKKDLKKLINNIEKRDVSDFNAEILSKIVKDIWKETGRSN